MTHFWIGQRVREKATGKLWYIAHVFTRSVIAYPQQYGGDRERVFKREELEPE